MTAPAERAAPPPAAWVPLTAREWVERQDVVAEARSWLGTPFHHAARVKGAGVDCSQLLVAVYADALALAPTPSLSPYPADWFLHTDEDRLVDVLRATCVPIARERVQIGDVATFRFGRAAAHAAIVVDVEPELVVIHAYVDVGVRVDVIDEHSAGAARLAGFWTLARWARGGVA